MALSPTHLTLDLDVGTLILTDSWTSRKILSPLLVCTCLTEPLIEDH